jgi:hypothetical protein
VNQQIAVTPVDYRPEGSRDRAWRTAVATSEEHDDLGGMVRMANNPKQDSPRKVSGSPTFVAATRIDEGQADVSFSDALVLARLVLEHGGGPVPARGKRALMDGPTSKRLSKLGLLRMEEGYGREVGTSSKPGLKISASAVGIALVTGVMEHEEASDEGLAPDPGTERV